MLMPVVIGVDFGTLSIFVYNNWYAYNELSDNIPLSEQLAMNELDEILRLRRFGNPHFLDPEPQATQISGSPICR
jgi:hypothetical protein